MTNSTTTSMQSSEKTDRINRRSADAAPMVVTRLSGWIDVNEMKADPRGWIIPTRIHQSAR